MLLILNIHDLLSLDAYNVNFNLRSSTVIILIPSIAFSLTKHDKELVERDAVIRIDDTERREDVVIEALDHVGRVAPQSDIQRAELLARHAAVRMKREEVVEDGGDLCAAQRRQLGQEFDVSCGGHSEWHVAQALLDAFGMLVFLLRLTHIVFVCVCFFV